MQDGFTLDNLFLADPTAVNAPPARLAKAPPLAMQVPGRRFTNLYNAARMGDVTALTSSIIAGGEVNERSPDPHLPTPLLAAVAANSVACVQLLISHGADVEGRCDVAQWTPLMVAVIMATQQRVTPIIRELCARGANPGAACRTGNTPLQEARKRHARGPLSAELVNFLAST
jgi:ankyrin repeat protein